MVRYFTLDLVPQLGGQLGLISAGVFYANTLKLRRLHLITKGST